MKTRSLSKRQGIRLLVAARQTWKCHKCQQILPPTFEIDHVRALAFHGTEVLQNFQALCPSCHRSKTMIERQVLADQNRENRTGISKYFDPECFSYMLKRKVHKKPKW